MPRQRQRQGSRPPFVFFHTMYTRYVYSGGAIDDDSVFMRHLHKLACVASMVRADRALKSALKRKRNLEPDLRWAYDVWCVTGLFLLQHS